MEKTILGTTLTLDTAPLHIAPGGSTLCVIRGTANTVAKCLMTLREEIAYGMADVRTLCENDKIVEVDIYFGKADDDIFQDMYKPYADDLKLVSTTELLEGTGLSMRARNQVIDALK